MFRMKTVLSKTLSLVLIFVLSLSLLSCLSSDKKDDYNEYRSGTEGLELKKMPKMNSYTYEVTGYTGTDPTVVIPNQAIYDVESISANAFAGNKTITSIFIPADVKSIGENAFLGCENLKTIHYCGDKLEWIALGDTSYLCGVEIIFDIDFSSFGLEFTLKKGGSYAITGVSYYYHHNLKIPTEFNGKPIASIGENAFSEMKYLEHVIIPDSVTTIGANAFADCEKLKSVVVPGSVRYIDANDFSGCPNLTIFFEVAQPSADWSADWNASGASTVWSYQRNQLFFTYPE